MIEASRTSGHPSFLSQRINAQQCKDSGMVVVLICLIAGYYSDDGIWETLAISFLLADLVFPSIYRPFAHMWFGVGQVLGIFTSKLLLILVYFLLVTPIGLARRLLGADPLRLKSWKAQGRSVFSVRDHTYRREDVENPF